jgi:hypothetical protein
MLLRLVVTLFVTGVGALLLHACADSLHETAIPGPPRDALLPRPSELTRHAAGNVQAKVDAVDFQAALPNRNVSVQDLQALFAPTGSNSLTELAYAMYEFNAPGLTSPNSVVAHWQTIPEDWWIATADFERDTWQWAPGTDGEPAYIPDGIPVNDMGNAYVAVVATGDTAALLNYVELSGFAATPPTAHITYAPYSEFTPRRDWAGVGEELYFSWAASFTTNGRIERYDLDWDGNGTYDQQYLPQVLDEPNDMRHAWDAPGEYTVGLRITDTWGFQATDTVPVRILGYGSDEAGSNDSSATAQPLTLPQMQFHGDINSGGDTEDWYSFTLATEKYVRLEYRIAGLDPPNSAMIELFADDGTTLLDAHTELIKKRYNAGTYFIRLTESEGQPHPYELEVAAADVLPEAEITADVLTADAPYLIRVEAYPLVFGSDLRLNVDWDLDGDAAFDAGYPLAPAANQRVCEFIVWSLDAFDIGATVTDWDGTVTTDTVQITPTGTAGETEPNDGSGVATQLTLVESPFSVDKCTTDPPVTLGRVNGPGDQQDWYAIDIPENGNLLLELDNGIVAWGGLELYGPDGSTLLDQQDGYRYGHVSIQRTLTPGRYYIRVRMSINEGDSIDSDYGLTTIFVKTGGSS